MNINFLKELLNTSSPSGSEFSLQKKWREYMKNYVHKVESDNIGNVYAYLNPNSEFKVLLTAHCDEIGFMVRKIDESGYIYLEKIGGISPKPALGMKVTIEGKEKVTGIVGVNSEHQGGEKDITFASLYLDCGFQSREEALKYINIGDVGTYSVTFRELLNNKIASKALDNKSGLLILSEVMKNLAREELDIGIVGVSTVNEETNRGGAYFAASKVEPQMSIILDVTFSGDYPRADDVGISLGGGPVLAKGAPIHIKINQHLEKVAAKENINLQYELTPRYTGTDGDVVRTTGRGVPIATISLPLRYMHSPVEVCDFKDIEDIIKLLTESLKNLKKDFNLSPLE